MQVTINPEFVYLTVTVVLMIIQMLQWRKINKLKCDIEDLWGQIGIMAMSAGGIFEKIKKDLDGKQDK
jgi:hypothetical protein